MIYHENILFTRKINDVDFSNWFIENFLELYWK